MLILNQREENGVRKSGLSKINRCVVFSSSSFTLLFKCDFELCFHSLWSASGNCSLQINVMQWKWRELNVFPDVYTHTQTH